jgi:hypothetical protein
MARFVAIALGLVVVGAFASSGSAAPVVESAKGRARIDWTRGQIIAVGAAAGDLRAPSAAVARVKARRIAGKRARTRLKALAAGVTLAGGGTVADKLSANAAATRRLDAAVARARELDLRYGSDGSVTATLALPLEAVRLALAGAPRPARAGGPTAVIVQAPAGLTVPRLGLALGAGAERYIGPVVFHRGTASATTDSRLGKRIVRAGAASLRSGVLQLTGIDAAKLGAARKAGALIVVVLPEKGK